MPLLWLVHNKSTHITEDKQMKKILSILLIAASTATMLAGCGSSATDWSYIEEKGKMTIGITYFEPMNYLDDNGELTGFETEFAQAVCEKMGVTPTFQKIDWDSKEVELTSKTIDCIWNGMTITDERKENMDISVAYMENKQVMVTKAENVEKYKNAENLAGATVVAEKKSAGESVATTDSFFTKANYVSVDSQAKALLEVKAGTADIAVIDYVMSIGTIANGTDYSSLKVIEEQSFAEEQYGIAFRKNSPETVQKVNDAIQELANEGKLKEIASKYQLQDLILVQPK
jgi:polar amino acid transport system substrate-binding protein